MSAATPLRVGECQFYVDVEKIKREFPESRLAEIFRENPNCISYFIDHDGEIFKYILSYLRFGFLQTSSIETEILSKISAAAEFYKLPQLVERLKNRLEAPSVFGEQLYVHVKQDGNEVHFNNGNYYQRFKKSCFVLEYQETLCHNLNVMLVSYNLKLVQILSNKDMIPETLYVFEVKKTS